MSSHSTNSDSSAGPKLDLSRWRNLPWILIAIGVVGGLAGLFNSPRQFAYSYLLAFIFFFSLCVGCLFLVLIHHLFDAGWSVPLRRITEHGAALLFPTMLILFVPIGLLAVFGGESIKLYPWMFINPHEDHALRSKELLLNKWTWLGASVTLFLIWGLLAHRLRFWSVKQDETGDARCTYGMRFNSYWGMWVFAFSVTLAIILWVKSIEHEWFSTMYGVYYFAESVWTTLATVYVVMILLKRSGPLAKVITPRQQHDLGVLWFAFTVFYAYIHFSQYFIIWNANIPEETFRYIERDSGGWHQIGLIIIFGHFLVPFLSLLRIDAKMSPSLIFPLAAWAWLMHFCDVSFNVMPSLHKDTFVLHWLDLTCLAFIAGVLILAWVKYFKSYAPFPQKDPRMAEALGLHHPQASSVAVAKYEGKP